MTQEVAQEFWQGVEQFNQGKFYACHDTLEALWIEAAEPLRNFYQGILQIAVACHHLENHNWRGAVILLGEGLSRLRNYLPAYASIDVAQLTAQTAHLLAELQQAGPERVAEFAQGLRVEVPANPVDAADVTQGRSRDASVSIPNPPKRPLLKVLPHETSQHRQASYS